VIPVDVPVHVAVHVPVHGHPRATWQAGVVHEQNEPAPRSGEDAAKSGPSPTLIALIVIGIVAVIFILQNGERSRTDFLMFDFSAPLWITILLAIAAGVLLDRLFTVWWRRRHRANDRD